MNMKKYFIVAVSGIMLLAFSSCFHHGHDFSITISDDEDEYEMDASYSKRQARAIRIYLNDHLLHNNIVLHKNNSVDEEITLDDNTTFYINSYPGEFRIKIDKRENSEESCARLKQICEELKEILAEN